MAIERIWKDIVWYEWYYVVSDKWEIKSIRKNKIMSLCKNGSWYLVVSLNKEWKQKTLSVHRIIAECFIKKIEWKNIVNHINWNKVDNSIYNLEWCTQSENVKHWYAKLWIMPFYWKEPIWKWKFWKLHPRSKKIEQIDKNYWLIKIWDSIMDIKRELWISDSNIASVCGWKRKTAWWFIWKHNLS